MDHHIYEERLRDLQSEVKFYSELANAREEVIAKLTARIRELEGGGAREDEVWQQQETDGEAQPALQRLEKKYMGVRDDARRLANAIVNAHYVSRRLANHAELRYEQVSDDLTKTINDRVEGWPLLEALSNAYRQSEDFAQSYIEELDQRIKMAEQQGMEPEKMLLTTMKNMFRAAHRLVGFSLTVVAVDRVDDPGLICDELLRQIDIFGQPSITMLGRLGHEWIKLKLPAAPKKLSTLQNGLTWAHRFKQMGGTQEEFLYEYLPTHYPERGVLDSKTLRRYVRWFEVIADTAAPQDPIE